MDFTILELIRRFERRFLNEQSEHERSEVIYYKIGVRTIGVREFTANEVREFITSEE